MCAVLHWRFDGICWLEIYLFFPKFMSFKTQDILIFTSWDKTNSVIGQKGLRKPSSWPLFAFALIYFTLCLVFGANDSGVFSCRLEAARISLQSHAALWKPLSVEHGCDRHLSQKTRQRSTKRETKRELFHVSKAIGPFGDRIWPSGAKSEAGLLRV